VRGGRWREVVADEEGLLADVVIDAEVLSAAVSVEDMVGWEVKIGSTKHCSAISVSIIPHRHSPCPI
jgi:hypothetical protein